MPHPEPSSEASKSLHEFVTTVYAEVWEQFYDWNTKYCQGVIDTLAAAQPSSPSPSFEQDLGKLPEDDAVALRHHFEGLFIQSPAETSGFLRVNFNSDESISGESKLVVETIPLEGAIRPSDVYESFTPVSRNIERGDDSDNMPFIPFADDPSFDSEDYMGFFGQISWQNETFRDPDSKLKQFVHYLTLE